jgi:immunoglobulin-like protein involved in spore germination/sporulation and spore germination protein
MKRLFLSMVVLLAACGPAKSGSLGPGPQGLPTPSTSTSPSFAESTPPSTEPPSTDGRTLTVQVWFYREGRLFATTRTRPVTQNTSHLALTELAAGPSTVETSAGVGSAVSTGTRFEIKGISPEGIETVSFPASFYDGGEALLRIRQAQVVYTLTQFPSVRSVRFLSDGAATIGGPFGRAEMADLLPRIVVYSPVIGQRVTSPITVSGIADVYESTVSVRVLNRDGKEIGAKFTTATCNTRCHGDYSMKVSFRSCASESGPGTVEVYMSSPDNGARVNTVGIPIQFAGCAT